MLARTGNRYGNKIRQFFSKGRAGNATMIYCLAVFFFWLSLPGAALAFEDNSHDETIIKAGFLYNFTKFIIWPDHLFKGEQGDYFSICVAGDDPIVPVLQEMAAKIFIGKRPLRVFPFRFLPENIDCQILFIGHVLEKNIKKVLAAVEGKPVLTIGDTPGFRQQGVGINFVRIGDSIKFEINSQVIEQAGLRVSSQLLMLSLPPL